MFGTFTIHSRVSLQAEALRVQSAVEIVSTETRATVQAWITSGTGIF